MSCLQRQAWKCSCHSESHKAYEFQALCWHLTSWIHAGARKWKIFYRRWWMLFCPHRIGNGLCLGLNVTQSCSWKCAEWHDCLTSLLYYVPVCMYSKNINCGEVSCLLPPASGFSWAPKALMGASIWDRHWLDLGQVTHSVFRNWDRAGAHREKLKDGASPLLSWRRWGPTGT